MLTIVLPGYSAGNKTWANEIAEKVNVGTPILVHEWRHWSEGGTLSESYEIKKIIDEIGNEKVNIIAKSVGTRITMNLIDKIVNNIEKIILCGIPTKFEGADIRDLYTKGLNAISPAKILVIQNSGDPFSPFSVVSEVIHSIEPEIKIIEKPANSHDYPYFEDFEAFLSEV
jgi:hypothetical protein